MAYQTCLRCGSPERYLVHTDGDNGQLHLSGTLQNLKTNAYACGECGYVERYVAEASIPMLRERATRATPE